jgi:hypothetical protein
MSGARGAGAGRPVRRDHAVGGARTCGQPAEPVRDGRAEGAVARAPRARRGAGRVRTDGAGRGIRRRRGAHDRSVRGRRVDRGRLEGVHHELGIGDLDVQHRRGGNRAGRGPSRHLDDHRPHRHARVRGGPVVPQARVAGQRHARAGVPRLPRLAGTPARPARARLLSVPRRPGGRADRRGRTLRRPTRCSARRSAGRSAPIRRSSSRSPTCTPGSRPRAW